MEKVKAFEEWNHILVPSSYGEWGEKKRYYRVFYGEVTWRESDPGNFHIACFPIVQFGNTEDYDQALRRRELVLNNPCHILEEDMDEVMEAMRKLRSEHKSKS